MAEKPKPIAKLKSAEKPESAKKPESLWQNLKVGLIIVACALVVGLIVVLIGGYHDKGWGWTGLNEGTIQVTITSTSKTNYSASVEQPYKTLWDWLGLLAVLAIPVVVGFGVALYTAQQAEESENNRKRQDQQDQLNREKRHDTDTKIAENNSIREQQTALKIAEDNRHEAAYRAYLDKMSELVLEKRLAHSTPGDRVRNIARIQTLAVLIGLDSIRKGNVLQFLYEYGLIIKDNCIVDLEKADLSGANLPRANLSHADLSFTDLSGANLQEADLREADLKHANLRQADLKQADLRQADLSGADLDGAKNITTDALKAQTKLLTGTTYPDRSTFEEVNL